MNSVVLFSGGCDSTLVLHQLALDQLRTNSYSNILALTIVNNNVSSECDGQKLARKEIQEEFKKRSLPVEFYEVNISEVGNSFGMNVNAEGIIQPIIWNMICSLYIQDHYDAYFGYHKGDDFWEIRHDFEEIFRLSCKVMNKTCQINYPLRHRLKYEIIHKLKEYGLYDLCWWCEGRTTDNVPCWKCLPCITHQMALYQLSITNKPTDEKCRIKTDDVRKCTEVTPGKEFACVGPS